MRILDSRRPEDFAKVLAQLTRRPTPETQVRLAVEKILRKVGRGGDAALIRINNRFSKKKISRSTLRVRGKFRAPPPKVRQALAAAEANIADFAKATRPKDWSRRNRQGARVGENFPALGRVGVYVPGGTAPLVSTALMTVVLARVAGVKEIVACTPAPVNPVLGWALQRAGATEIYQVGGAQAVAAMAYGTETIRPVEKICGPGSAWVVEAKRQLFGRVGIDLLPGPSEIAVVADESARADWVAADLVAQAEHGPGSQIFLLTPSFFFLGKVLAEVLNQSGEKPRAEYLRDVLSKGATLVRTRDLRQAIELAEAIAPEHLSLQCRGAKTLAQKIRCAGAVFIGNPSAVALGDYLSGPSHTLPTGGAGRAFAGLRVEDFVKRVSVVEYSPAAVRKSARTVGLLARLERLDAHADSVETRLS
ncbi:MAG: histidinol dehydrogenase [Verrucomicrobia bacterium]|nr:histidinol dehydrogenase [Verrucomicrobiota bacterium]